MRNRGHWRSRFGRAVAAVLGVLLLGRESALAQAVVPTSYRVLRPVPPRVGFSYQAGYAANGVPALPAGAVLGWGPGAWVGPGLASQGFGAWTGPAPAFGSGYPGYGFGSPGEGYRGGYPIGPPGYPAGLPGAGRMPRRPVPSRR